MAPPPTFPPEKRRTNSKTHKIKDKGGALLIGEEPSSVLCRERDFLFVLKQKQIPEIPEIPRYRRNRNKSRKQLKNLTKL